MTDLYLVTEDALSECVAEKVVAGANQNLNIAVRMGRKGNGYLRERLPKLVGLSEATPVFMLTDLDRVECAPTLIEDWTAGHDLPPSLLLRVAVREVEAWLLADRTGFAEFVGAPLNKIPPNPEALADPKQTLLNLVRKHGGREIKNEILPAPHSKSPIGLGYNQTLATFVNEAWDPERAAINSDSLARAQIRLQAL